MNGTASWARSAYRQIQVGYSGAQLHQHLALKTVAITNVYVPAADSHKEVYGRHSCAGAPCKVHIWLMPPGELT